MTKRFRRRTERPGLCNPYAVEEEPRIWGGSAVAVGATLAGAAGLLVLSAGAASAEEGDGSSSGSSSTGGSTTFSGSAGGLSGAGSSSSSAGGSDTSDSSTSSLSDAGSSSSSAGGSDTSDSSTSSLSSASTSELASSAATGAAASLGGSASSLSSTSSGSSGADQPGTASSSTPSTPEPLSASADTSATNLFGSTDLLAPPADTSSTLLSTPADTGGTGLFGNPASTPEPLSSPADTSSTSLLGSDPGSATDLSSSPAGTGATDLLGSSTASTNPLAPPAGSTNLLAPPAETSSTSLLSTPTGTTPNWLGTPPTNGGLDLLSPTNTPGPLGAAANGTGPDLLSTNPTTGTDLLGSSGTDLLSKPTSTPEPLSTAASSTDVNLLAPSADSSLDLLSTDPTTGTDLLTTTPDRLGTPTDNGGLDLLNPTNTRGPLGTPANSTGLDLLSTNPTTGTDLLDTSGGTSGTNLLDPAGGTDLLGTPTKSGVDLLGTPTAGGTDLFTTSIGSGTTGRGAGPLLSTGSDAAAGSDGRTGGPPRLDVGGAPTGRIGTPSEFDLLLGSPGASGTGTAGDLLLPGGTAGTTSPTGGSGAQLDEFGFSPPTSLQRPDPFAAGSSGFGFAPSLSGTGGSFLTEEPGQLFAPTLADPLGDGSRTAANWSAGDGASTTGAFGLGSTPATTGGPTDLLGLPYGSTAPSSSTAFSSPTDGTGSTGDTQDGFRAGTNGSVFAQMDPASAGAGGTGKAGTGVASGTTGSQPAGAAEKEEGGSSMNTALGYAGVGIPFGAGVGTVFRIYDPAMGGSVKLAGLSSLTRVGPAFLQDVAMLGGASSVPITHDEGTDKWLHGNIVDTSVVTAGDALLKHQVNPRINAWGAANPTHPLGTTARVTRLNSGLPWSSLALIQPTLSTANTLTDSFETDVLGWDTDPKTGSPVAPDNTGYYTDLTARSGYLGGTIRAAAESIKHPQWAKHLGDSVVNGTRQAITRLRAPAPASPALLPQTALAAPASLLDDVDNVAALAAAAPKTPRSITIAGNILPFALPFLQNWAVNRVTKPAPNRDALDDGIDFANRNVVQPLQRTFGQKAVQQTATVAGDTIAGCISMAVTRANCVAGAVAYGGTAFRDKTDLGRDATQDVITADGSVGDAFTDNVGGMFGQVGNVVDAATNGLNAGLATIAAPLVPLYELARDGKTAPVSFQERLEILAEEPSVQATNRAVGEYANGIVRNVRNTGTMITGTAEAGGNLLNEVRQTVGTGLRRTPTTGLGATGVAAANFADGMGDAILGTGAALLANGDQGALDLAGNRFRESGRSFARARDAAGIAASESWKVATDLGTRGRNFLQYGDVGGAAAVAPKAPLDQPWCETSTLSACVERGSIDPSNPNSVGELRVGPKVRAPGGQLVCSPVLTSNCVAPFSVDPANPNSVGQLRVGPKIVGAGVPGNPAYEQLVREGRAGDQSKPGSAGYGKGPAGVPQAPVRVDVGQVQQEISSPGYARQTAQAFARQEAARPPAPKVDVVQAAQQTLSQGAQAATTKARETAAWAGDVADGVADAAQKAPVIGGAVGWLRNNVPGLGGDGDPNR